MKRNLIIGSIICFLIAACCSVCLSAQAVHRHIEPETLAYQALSGAAQTQFTTNENIKSIKYASGITLSSVTVNVSAVDLTSFLTNPSVDLRPYAAHGWKVKIFDSSNRYLEGVLGNVGSGETFTDIIAGDTLNGNMETGNPPTGWLASNCNVSGIADERTGGAGSQSLSIVGTSGNGWGYRSVTLGVGSLFKISGYWKKITSSAGGILYNSNYTTVVSFGNSASLSWAALTEKYGTASTVAGLYIMFALAPNEARYDDMYLGKVLTPSTSGCTILNAAGAQSFISKDASFTYNAKSYTATITRE